LFLEAPNDWFFELDCFFLVSTDLSDPFANVTLLPHYFEETLSSGGDNSRLVELPKE
jgi:hypothetical protein